MNTEAVNVRKKYKKKSQAGAVWHRFKKSKSAMLGLALFIIIMLVVILADVMVSYDLAITNNIMNGLKWPSSEHWFGTDNFGRDIFARIVHGSRNSLLVGIGAVAIGITVGGVFGAVAGYYGGWIDAVLVKIMDTIMAIPLMLLVLTIVAALVVKASTSEKEI